MIAVCGGERRFVDFVRRVSRNEFMQFDTCKEAFEFVLKNGTETLLILPDYEESALSVGEFCETEIECLAKIISLGKTKVYLENYPAFDYRDRFIFSIQARGAITPMVNNSIAVGEKLSAGKRYNILQKRNGQFFPNNVRADSGVEILAEIKNCIGAHRVVASVEESRGAALIKKGENLFVSMVDITNLKNYEIFSYSNWRDFYAALFSKILAVSEQTVFDAFGQCYEGIGVRGECEPTRFAMEEAILDAIAWHLNSGLMLDSGRGGIYEMIRSFDLNAAKNIRGDSSLFTAALFLAAGKYFNDEKLVRISENISNHLLNERGIQLEEGKNKGLFKWFSGIGGLGCCDVYSSDTSRVGNSVFALYKMSGDEKLKDRILELGEALLRWFGGNALLPVANFCYDRDDLESIQSETRCLAPEFYDAPLIFLKNLYSITADERYKEQIIKTAKRLANAYPDYPALASHSENFTFGRLLGALSAAQSFGDGVWTEVIDKLLDYFKEHQHECGGFFDGVAYFDPENITGDMEFAVGFGKDNGNIADFVYCQNTMAYSLNILNRCEGGFNKKLARQMLDGLLGFILSAQIKCEDKRFHGGWMRAFDMDSKEYYGCDKDFAWGPYCILTGWVTGTLPLVLLDALGFKTMY